ncbi:flagellar hook-basal body complex protein [Planococcus ruber]|uniref:flagellar hook-basal body complex protein n=1 Tax=Planococcus ruber TaxID=2027871 RepID=UPI001FEFCB0D|nr:flagellar hook-basal body complex protein [Planococcus ruber]MCJ1909761.1 flagellar hook-basal body complex protein [Planococcus ruber]
MLRSMYSGVSGMKGFQTKLDVIGNNIANVNTIGYKKSTINFQDLLSQNLSGSGVNPMQVGLGSMTAAINTIHTPGSSMTTGVGTDLSIMGDGYFVVQDPDNAANRFLTRAGNFVLNSTGQLVNPQGYQVVGTNGPITINPQTYDSFTINGQGEVYAKTAAGAETLIANIGISNPPNPSGLSKVGGSLYEITNASGGSTAVQTVGNANTQLGTGMLEMSNVDLTEEFTEMIVAQRGFQANSRTITTSDEILQEVVNLKR